MITIGNKRLNTIVVDWLTRIVPRQAWVDAGVGAYVNEQFWGLTRYEEVDADPVTGEEDCNLRRMCHSTQPGIVRISTDPKDEKVRSVSIADMEFEWSSSLAQFLKLANAETYEPPPIPRGDFGTW